MNTSHGQFSFFATFLMALGFFFIPLLFSVAFPNSYSDLKWLFVLSSAPLLLLSAIRLPLHLKLERHEQIALGVFLIALITQIFIHQDFIASLAKLKIVVFFSLVFSTAIIIKQSERNLDFALAGLIPAFVCTAIYGLLQNFGIELIVETSLKDSFYTSAHTALFGHVAAVGEFLAICLLYFFYLYKIAKPKYRSWLIGLLVSTVIYLLACRSVSVVIALTTAIGCIYCRRKTVIPVLIAALAFILLSLFIYEPLWLTKMNNFSWRLQIWEASLGSIREHLLWGVGIGKYLYANIPYHPLHSPFPVDDFMLDDNPHNEPLRYLTELGIIVCIAWIGMVIALGKRVLSSPGSERKKLALAILAFISMHSLFFFPLLNPFLFWTAAIAIGYLLSPISQIAPKPYRKRYYAIIAGVFFVLANGAHRFGYGRYLEQNFFTNLERITKACKLNPDNHSACMQKAHLEFVVGYYADARLSLAEMLKQYPQNLPALKKWREISEMDPEIKEACIAEGTYIHWVSRRTWLKSINPAEAEWSRSFFQRCPEWRDKHQELPQAMKLLVKATLTKSIQRD